MLKGQKIILRPWLEADLEFFGKLRNDVETQLALLAQPRPNPPGRVRQWLEDRASVANSVFFVVATEPDGRAAGFVELRDIQTTHGWGHLGICIDPIARGRGFAVEALGLLESYARRVLMLRKIVLFVAANNTPARHLYSSTGYTTVGVHHEHYHVGGEWLDAVVMEKNLAVDNSTAGSGDELVQTGLPVRTDGRKAQNLIAEVASP